MNGVIGYAELVHELSEGEELRKYAQVILDSSQHLLALLNSILDLARVEAGSVQLSRAPEAVDELVEKVCATYRAVAAGKGLALCRELAELMNGTVTLRSSPEEGGVFRLVLPLGDKKGAQ